MRQENEKATTFEHIVYHLLEGGMSVYFEKGEIGFDCVLNPQEKVVGDNKNKIMGAENLEELSHCIVELMAMTLSKTDELYRKQAHNNEGE